MFKYILVRALKFKFIESYYVKDEEHNKEWC